MSNDVLFIQGLPTNLKKRFKVACAKKGVSMKEALIEFMKTFSKQKGQKII
jgi:hypothetical protein